MSQFDFGDLESPLPGATFINGNLEPWRDALHSMHSGTSRPSYAVDGTMWLDDTTDPWILNVYDGTSDVALGTIDISTHSFTPNGVVTILDNYSATTDPTVNDDSGDGYTYGSKWYNTVSQEAYLLVDPTPGAAKWILITLDAEDLGSAAFLSVEEVRSIPQNSQSAAYTLVLSDAGKHIFHPSADTTNRTFTIPANSSVAFPIGTAVTFVNQNGTGGVITIAITTDTMRLAGTGTTGSRNLARNGIATALKITSTEWIISGTGIS